MKKLSIILVVLFLSGCAVQKDKFAYLENTAVTDISDAPSLGVPESTDKILTINVGNVAGERLSSMLFSDAPWLDSDGTAANSTLLDGHTASYFQTALTNPLVLGGSYTPTGTWDWTYITGTWPTFNQSTTGNSATSTKLATARTISGQSFDGSANITIPSSGITVDTTDFALNLSSADDTVLKALNTLDDLIAGSVTVYPDAGIPVSLGESGWDDSLTLDIDGTTVSSVDDTILSAKATKEQLDLKANTSGLSVVLSALSDMLILDTAEPVDGSNWLDDSIDYGDTDDNMHLWSIEQIGSLLAEKNPVRITIHKAANYTLGTDSALECTSPVTVFVSSAATITACPYASTVKDVTVTSTAAVAVSLKMNAADYMLRDGTAMDTGDKATSQSEIGDTAYCEPHSTGIWYCWTGSNSGVKWTDGGQ